ncbi:MAG: hypothetical protein ACI84D_003570, partial [Thalassolituus oleivorans]
ELSHGGRRRLQRQRRRGFGPIRRDTDLRDAGTTGGQSNDDEADGYQTAKH